MGSIDGYVFTTISHTPHPTKIKDTVFTWNEQIGNKHAYLLSYNKLFKT